MKRKETWLPIARCPLYEISNLGRVRRITYKASYLSVPDGYPTVQLWSEGRYITVAIHRLVAEAFIPNPDNLPEVNHKDRNRTHCAVENLEWMTSIQNQEHSWRNGRKSRLGPRPVLGFREIEEIRSLAGKMSYYALAKKYGTTRQSIQRWIASKARVTDKWPAARGEASGKAKLTEHQVRCIRALRSAGVGVSVLARMFEGAGIARTTINGIVSGKTWKHLL
jgi:DNA-binding transcriptional regulator YiaG